MAETDRSFSIKCPIDGQHLTRAFAAVYGYNGLAFCKGKVLNLEITSKNERGGVSDVTAV